MTPTACLSIFFPQADKMSRRTDYEALWGRFVILGDTNRIDLS